jgi:PII-like signaling protein
MLQTGPAKKLIIYISQSDRYEGIPLYEALLHLLHKRGCAGATATKGIAGFGPHGVFHTSKILRLTQDLPVRIEVVESAEKIDAMLPFVHDMVKEGLIELQDTEVIKYTHKHEIKEEPQQGAKMKGHAMMLRIFVGEKDRFEGVPLYEAIVKRLKMVDIAGATVFKGIMGYGAKSRIHSKTMLGISEDLPIMITVVDTEQRIRQVLPEVEDMVGEGLVVLSEVEISKYSQLHDEDDDKEIFP